MKTKGQAKPAIDAKRQAELTADATTAMRELIARIPRGYDYAAEPEMLFVPRRATPAAAPARRRARS
ncbi:MAG: hypothetical protein ACK51F_06620 [Rhodospirillales bacterium]|jgi:hypothetical protein